MEHQASQDHVGLAAGFGLGLQDVSCRPSSGNPGKPLHVGHIGRRELRRLSGDNSGISPSSVMYAVIGNAFIFAFDLNDHHRC